ncbi:MAG: hypothetical protein VX265_18235 [Myxococcota bacterium]|nr:hypothetical protein [Myxococcota bacterium]MEC8425661.1 hypothetical protein [Myxococcota bacterium]
MPPDPDWRKHIPAALLERAPVPSRVRYARVGRAGPFELPRVVLEETWGEPQPGPDGVRFRRVTRDITNASRVVEDACVRYGPAGLEDLGTYRPDGILMLWEPPQRVLSAEPTIGETWTSRHVRDGSLSDREVTLAAAEHRPDWLVCVAETRREDGVIVLRINYALGEGFVGYEALIQSPGRPSVRTWTEALTVETRSG